MNTKLALSLSLSVLLVAACGSNTRSNGTPVGVNKTSEPKAEAASEGKTPDANKELQENAKAANKSASKDKMPELLNTVPAVKTAGVEINSDKSKEQPTATPTAPTASTPSIPASSSTAPSSMQLASAPIGEALTPQATTTESVQLKVMDVLNSQLFVTVKDVSQMQAVDGGALKAYDIAAQNQDYACVLRVISLDVPTSGTKLRRFSKAEMNEQGQLVVNGRISFSRSALRESVSFICQAVSAEKNVAMLTVDQLQALFAQSLEITVVNQ